MDNRDRDSVPNDSRKDLTISTLVNATDMVSQETYQTNLQRIQDAKEMVRRFEMNNETAHKNFLFDQLQKRAQDGRNAEEQLARLKSQQVISELAQVAPNVPTAKPDVLLPTTATLVEVPESRSSHSAPAPTATSRPQVIPSNYQYQGGFPTQPYFPETFRYYVPPNAVRQPLQQNTQSFSRQPVDSRRTAQNVPAATSAPAYQTGFQQRQVQQPTWGSYRPPQADTVFPSANTFAYGVPWATAPAQGSLSTGSFNPASFYQSGFPTLPPVTAHNQSQNLPLPASTSQVQMPHQVISLVVGPPSGQPPVRPQPQSTEPYQPPQKLQKQSSQRPVQPHQHPQVSHQQPQRPTQPQPRQRPQPPQTLHQQPQRLPQAPVQPQQDPQPSQTLNQKQPSQRPLAGTKSHAPSQSTKSPDLTQVSQPTSVEEQVRSGQAVFNKVFQEAAKRDVSHLRALWNQGKAAGISDQWFSDAIKSLPPGLWQSLKAQADQLGSNANAPPIPSALQQQGPPIPTPNVTAVGAQIPPVVISHVHPTPVAEHPTPTIASGGQSFPQYTTQLQYYAVQATQSALSTQAANTFTSPPENVTLTHTVPVTPRRDVLRMGANVRTPKDANKMTLARDILRSLGKAAPHSPEGEPTDQTDEHQGDLLCEVPVPESPSRAASLKRPVTPPVIALVNPNLSLTPSARQGVPDEPQYVTLESELESELKEKRQDAVIDRPIMIDLTLDNTDESADENGQGRTFPKQTTACATSSQPTPVVTTDHTPLLENLSLEELPVDVAADSHNADVPMNSPPLSFAAGLEENMEAESLFPLPANAEPILPSFEPPPREASADRPDGKLPLFLPSPPVSPADSKPPETDVEMIPDEEESGVSLKRQCIDVDEIENGSKVDTPPRFSKRRKVAYVLIPPAPLYVRNAKLKGREREESVDSDLDGVGDDEEIRYSRFEQLLIEESKPRLLERRCRWTSCGAILNCAAHLLTHLKNHARDEELKGAFLCLWGKCQRQLGDERERDVHLERHTIRPLPCPFAGCDEQFDNPVQVMQHEVQHQKGEQMEPLIHKATCKPIVPAIPTRLGPPPQHLPSHRVVPRRVLKCRISADRHAIVGPWVLWNIWSPVDLGTRKQNAPMRGRPTRQGIDYDTDRTDPRRDEYDFLMALSSYPTKNPALDDLDCGLMMNDLTLWGSEDAVKSDKIEEREEGGADEEEVAKGMLIL